MAHTKTRLLAAGLLAAALIAPAAAQETGAAPVAPPSDAPAADKLDFKLRLKKGDKLYFRQTTNMSQDMDVGGMKVTTGSESVSDYSYDVTDVAETGEMTVLIKYGRVHGSLTNSMMGGSTAFDSDKELESTGNPMIDGALAMATAPVGHEITLVLTSNGEIQSVEGAADLLDIMYEANPMAGMMGLTDVAAMEKSLKSTFEGFFSLIPAEPVAVGETWKSERGMAGGGGMDLQLAVTSTLKSIEGDDASVVSTIEGTVDSGGMVEVDVQEFSGTSESKISTKDGLPQTATTKIKMIADAMTPQGQVAITMNTTTKLDRVESLDKPAVTPSEPPEEKPAETPSEKPPEDVDGGGTDGE